MAFIKPQPGQLRGDSQAQGAYSRGQETQGGPQWPEKRQDAASGGREDPLRNSMDRGPRTASGPSWRLSRPLSTAGLFSVLQTSRFPVPPERIPVAVDEPFGGLSLSALDVTETAGLHSQSGAHVRLTDAEGEAFTLEFRGQAFIHRPALAFLLRWIWGTTPNAVTPDNSH